MARNILGNAIIETIVSIVKLILIYKLTQTIGYILAIVLTYFIHYIYRRTLRKLGLTQLSVKDKIFIGNKDVEIMTLSGVMLFKNFDLEKFKERMRYSMKENRKMNTRLVYKFFNYYWQQQELTEERFNQLVKVIPNIKNYDDAIAYSLADTNVPMELTNSGLEIHVLPYTDADVNTNAAVYVKYDHCFSDGMGMVSLLFTMSDNFSADCFPKSMSKKQKPSFISNLISILKFSLTGLGVLFKIFSLKRKSKIFTNQNVSGRANFGKPILLDLNKIKAIKNSLNLTINEVCLSLISIALKKLDPNTEHYSMAIPIGNTKAPKSLKATQLRNQMSGITFDFALINNIDENKKISQELKQLMATKIIMDGLDYVGIILNEVLPFIAVKAIAMNIASQVDIVVSNMPGPNKVLIYDGMELEGMIPLSSTGPNKTFITIFSYVDKMWFTPEVDSADNIDPEAINRIIKEEIEVILKKINIKV